MSSYIPRSLLDQYPADNSQPDYRMSMLPFGTYPNADGSGEHLGLAMPGMISEPINALSRLMGTPSHPGTFGQGPDAPGNADDMRTLLETFFGGNATDGLATGARGAGESAAAHALPAPADAAYRNFAAPQSAPGSIRVYRGSQGSDLASDHNIPSHLLPDRSGKMFMTTSPDVANTYAGLLFDLNSYDFAKNQGLGNAAVLPADAKFANPLTVDARSNYWSAIPFDDDYLSTDDLTKIAKQRGHDGLVIKNVRDSLGLSNMKGLLGDTVVPLQRGTVTSPLTGETLFSYTGKPSLMGSAVAGAHPSLLAPALQSQQQYPNSLFNF